MKNEVYTDLNVAALGEKLRDEKIKLLNLRADIATRKLKNVKEINKQKKDIARILFALGQKQKLAPVEKKPEVVNKEVVNTPEKNVEEKE